MCISLMIASMVMSVAGSAMSAMQSGAAADSEAKWNQYNLQVQNQQLEDQKDMTRLQAGKVEADRLEASNAQRQRNLAFLASSGVDESMSFDQAIQPYNDKQTQRDVANLRLNSADTISRISDQIAVNNANITYGFQKADMTKQAANTKAFFGAADGVLGSVYKANYYKV